MAVNPPRPAWDGPVRLFIAYALPLPRSYPNAMAGAYCFRKPDQDNLEKLVVDALTSRGWWSDDGRVCHTEHLKFYSSEPGLAVEVKFLARGVRPSMPEWVASASFTGGGSPRALTLTGHGLL